jgi:hypothetical protein
MLHPSSPLTTVKGDWTDLVGPTALYYYADDVMFIDTPHGDERNSGVIAHKRTISLLLSPYMQPCVPSPSPCAAGYRMLVISSLFAFVYGRPSRALLL